MQHPTLNAQHCPRPELSLAIEWLWLDMKVKSNHASKPDSGKAA
jgi:hypothetical protein